MRDLRFTNEDEISLDKINFKGKKYKFILEGIPYISASFPRISRTEFEAKANYRNSILLIKYLNPDITLEEILEYLNLFKNMETTIKLTDDSLNNIAEEINRKDTSKMLVENNSRLHIVFNPKFEISFKYKLKIYDLFQDRLKDLGIEFNSR